MRFPVLMTLNVKLWSPRCASGKQPGRQKWFSSSAPGWSSILLSLLSIYLPDYTTSQPRRSSLISTFRYVGPVLKFQDTVPLIEKFKENMYLFPKSKADKYKNIDITRILRSITLV
jgi:hypothetical protein